MPAALSKPEFAVRYFATVVTELTAAGCHAEDIDAAIARLLVEAHADHPAVIDEVLDTIVLNTSAALAILRDDGR